MKNIIAFAFYFLCWFCCFLGTGTDRKNLAGLRSYPDAVQKAVQEHPVLGKAAPQEKSIIAKRCPIRHCRAAGGSVNNSCSTVCRPRFAYLLSFAAGAMLYVVVEELIPEMSAGRHSNIGTVSFALGFRVMMVLDVVLG